MLHPLKTFPDFPLHIQEILNSLVWAWEYSVYGPAYLTLLHSLPSLLIDHESTTLTFFLFLQYSNSVQAYRTLFSIYSS